MPVGRRGRRSRVRVAVPVECPVPRLAVLLLVLVFFFCGRLSAREAEPPASAKWLHHEREAGHAAANFPRARRVFRERSAHVWIVVVRRR